MCQSTARRIGAGDVDSRIALFDVRDLSLHIDHEGGPVGHAVLGNQDAVQRRDFAIVIAQQGEFRSQFFGPMSQCGSRIGADCQHLAVFGSEVRDTSLVRREFLGSATGERGRKECQDDVLLTAEIGKLDCHTVAGTVGADGEIRRGIANLQRCFRHRDVLGESRRCCRR